MTNPVTIDRQDVAHAINPLGGQTHVEGSEKPDQDALEWKAAKLSAEGNGAERGGMESEIPCDLWRRSATLRVRQAAI